MCSWAGLFFVYKNGKYIKHVQTFRAVDIFFLIQNGVQNVCCVLCQNNIHGLCFFPLNHGKSLVNVHVIIEIKGGLGRIQPAAPRCEVLFG